MSKIITRKRVRLVDSASVKTGQSRITTEKIHVDDSTHAVQNLPAKAKFITGCTINATTKAGFEYVDVTVTKNRIHISGDNGRGEVFASELKLEAEDQVESIQTDSLNVRDCKAVNEVFNNSLRDQGVSFLMAETIYTGQSCKPPVPISKKHVSAKKYAIKEKNKLSR